MIKNPRSPYTRRQMGAPLTMLNNPYVGPGMISPEDQMMLNPRGYRPNKAPIPNVPRPPTKDAEKPNYMPLLIIGSLIIRALM